MNVRRAGFSGGLLVSAGVRTALSASFAREPCVRCGVSVSGSLLCRECAALFVSVPDASSCCPGCGRLLVSEIGECMECRSLRVVRSADSVRALHPYRLWCKNFLFAWKAGGRRGAAELCARAVVRALMEFPGVPVVPVPPRPGKIRAKGWDQVADLCRVLRLAHGVPVMPLLVRLSSEQQKKKDRDGRLVHGARAYALNRRFLRRLSPPAALPGEVVLLDDVMTTGATAESCASLLKSCGIRKVHVLSLFIVD